MRRQRFAPALSFGVHCNSIRPSDGCALQVSVYKGGARDSTKDVLLGFFTLSLRALITGSKVKGKFPLLPPSQQPAGASLGGAGAAPAAGAAAAALYSGTVAAEIRGDAALEAFCLGCRVIDVGGPSLGNVPKRWRLPESEWAEVEETAAGGAADIPADPAAVAAMCDGASRVICAGLAGRSS